MNIAILQYAGQTYTLLGEPDDNGTILVTCPELPELTTYGTDLDDALVHGVRAITEARAAREASSPEPLARGDVRTGEVVRR